MAEFAESGSYVFLAMSHIDHEGSQLLGIYGGCDGFQRAKERCEEDQYGEKVECEEDAEEAVWRCGCQRWTVTKREVK